MAIPHFSFLSPATGLGLAAVAIPALLFLYFLKLRRRPARVSSTLLWDAAVQDLQVNAPFRLIRPSWMLLLQLAALISLLVALSRPAIDAAGTRGERLIILLDRSASMSAVDGADHPAPAGPGSRLEDAQRRAVELVNRAVSSGGARAMVIAFANEAAPLTNLTRDRALLRGAIEQIEPTDQPGNVEAAFKLVEAIASQAGAGEEQFAPVRVILFSDAGFGDDPSISGAGLERVSVEFIRCGPPPDAPRDNVGIVVLAARRDYEDPAMVRLFLRVISTAPRGVDAGLRCDVDGQSVATASITLPPATPAGPASITHTFEFQNTLGGACSISLTRGDDLASDNAVALLLAPTAGLRIALVQPAGANRPADAALVQALSTLEPTELRRLTPADLITPSPGRTLDSIDLVVFNRVRPDRLPAAPSISFGATIPIPGLSLEPPAEASGSGTFAFWLRNHPVMRYVSLGNIVVSRAGLMRLPEDAPGGVLSDAGAARCTALASGTDGPLIALAEQGLTRRIVIGFDLAQSNWWRSDSFPIFMANAADYLTLRGEESSGVFVTTTQPVRLRTGLTAGENVALVSPDATRRQAVVDEDGVAGFGIMPRTGLYRVDPSTPGTPAFVGVNLLDVAESRIATRDSLSIAGRPVNAGQGSRAAPREVWGWFAMLGVALLAIEWLLFAWRMRI